jgi:putative colanic acid biosynthesis UDP-glucose lipid carrier transferase
MNGLLRIVIHQPMRGKYYSRIIKVMIFVIDFLLINLAFKAARLLELNYGIPEYQFTSFFLMFAFIWIIAGFFNKIYRIESLSITKNLRTNLFNTALVHVVLIISMLMFFPMYRLTIGFLMWVYVLSAALIVGSRVIYKLILKYYEFLSFDQRNVVVVGLTRSGKAIYNYFKTHHAEGYRFKGFFADDLDCDDHYKSKIAGGLSDLKEFCIAEKIDEIYFTLPLTARNEELIKDLSKFADDNFMYLRISPDFSTVVHDNYNVFLINSVPILTRRKEPLGVSANVFLKRSFDLVFSSLVILTAFPIVFPIIAFAIRFDSPGPIFFKQLRPGKKNKLFECYKFRTMRVNQAGELQATKGDPRITKVGRFLRKTNLDELPQFFNVLLGSMSVVGPRPNMTSQLEEYSKTIQEYRVRHFITPGITGYAQVNGFRGETREPGLMEKRVQYDVTYLENWSLALDMKIILLTVWNMIRGQRNAY